MVTLHGINYDFSQQSATKLVEDTIAGSTTLNVENTEDYAINDYLIIASGTEIAEIVQITAEVTSDTILTVSATKFEHLRKVEIYRTPYNEMNFYQCDIIGGTYTFIRGTEMTFDNATTSLDHNTAITNYYYKRTFYNDTTAAESDIGLSIPWQLEEDGHYITEEELRTFLIFGPNDYPSREDMTFFIKIASKQINLDVDSTDPNVLFIASLLLSKSYVMRGLATKSISKGYIQVNAEGRTITKSYQEMVLEAENVFQEYKAFILMNGRQEVSSTNFLSNTANISSITRQDIIDMMNGVSDAVDLQNQYRHSSFWSRR